MEINDFNSPENGGKIMNQKRSEGKCGEMLEEKIQSDTGESDKRKKNQNYTHKPIQQKRKTNSRQRIRL